MARGHLKLYAPKQNRPMARPGWAPVLNSGSSGCVEVRLHLQLFGCAHWGGGSFSEPLFPRGDAGTLQEHWRLFLPRKVKVHKQLSGTGGWGQKCPPFSFLVPSRPPLQGKLESLSMADRNFPVSLTVFLGRRGGRVCVGRAQVPLPWALSCGAVHGNDSLAWRAHPATEAFLPFTEEPLS